MQCRNLTIVGIVCCLLLLGCGKGPPIAATSNRDYVVIAYYDRGMATTPGVLAVEVVGPRLNPTTRRLIRELVPHALYTMSLDDAGGLLISSTDSHGNSPACFIANLESWSGNTVEINLSKPVVYDELVDTLGIKDGYSTLYSLRDSPADHVFERMHELKAQQASSGIFTAYFIEADSIHFVNSTDHGVIVGVVWPGISEEALFEVDLINLSISRLTPEK